jgi:asparagine synthase (glutamine-hydrolysing)
VGAIAVFLARGGPPDPGAVERMAAAAPHRGDRVEVVVEGRCALACVTDELDDACLTQANGLAVAFSGTLDNAEELRALFGESRVRTLAPTAADVVAEGFRTWGEQLPNRMRGVFSVAVTDGERVLCFRDHVGFGLLFYRSDASGLYAATEAKQVVAGARIAREPDLDVIQEIVFRNLYDEAATAVRGVRRLPKGHLLTSGGKSERVVRFWDPARFVETAKLGHQELKSRFDELLDQAVSRALTGHDAIFLSGGIDSPALAAFGSKRHRELSGKPLTAIGGVFPRYPSVDERPYIELAAKAFGVSLQTYEPTAGPLESLRAWIDVVDGPAPPVSLAAYAESYRVARDFGFRNVLTGELAEAVVETRSFLLDHLFSHLRFRAARSQLGLLRARGASAKVIARRVAGALAPGALRAAHRRRRPAGVPDWIDLRTANVLGSEWRSSPRRRWTQGQVAPLRGPGLSLEANEICQAVCGVRSRSPWADVDLWEFFLSLPAEVKFPDDRPKGLVRKLLKGRLPNQILERKDKTVFDESTLASIEYETLRELLVAPSHRFEGIDYELLGQRLRDENLNIQDYRWASSLAQGHAFLSLR